MSTVSTATAGVVYLALELSRSTWLAAARLPGVERTALRKIEAGDTASLLALVTRLRKRAQTQLGCPVDVVCCFEAGRDGF